MPSSQSSKTKSAPRLLRVSRCIYRLEGSKTFFHSVMMSGKKYPTKRKLVARTLSKAITEVETLHTRIREAQLGVGLNPYSQLVTVGELATSWQDAHCQDRNARPRIGNTLRDEVARLSRLLPFWKCKAARDIVAYEDCPEYHIWRVKMRDAKKGKHLRLGRSVDSELTTLSNLLAWAAMNPRKTGLKYNPIANRPRFDNPKLVRHCTKVMPMGDEDFHRLAEHLLGYEPSAPLGWQLLLEGLTGCRTSEILACRLDARMPDVPGYMDHSALTVHRLKDGIKPYSILETAPGHSPLRDCLQAFRNWHEKKHPKNKWFIPGRSKTPGDGLALKSAHADSLTHALHRACDDLGMPLVISHGLRAYFVAVMRSIGNTDSQIADCLGHRSTSQIEQTYGTVRAGFRNSWQMDFLPEDCAPAWAKWMPKHLYQNLIVPKDEKRIGRPQPHGVV